MQIRARHLTLGLPRGKINPGGKILTANLDRGKMIKASVKVDLRKRSSPQNSVVSATSVSLNMIYGNISKTIREET